MPSTRDRSTAPLAARSAGPVGAVVRATNRAVRALRWVEAALLGAAVLLATLAALESGRGSGIERDGLALASVLAVIASASAARALLPSAYETARALDQRHGKSWALVAAFERERSASPTELDALLSERACSGLELGQALEGQAASAVPALAAPLVAAALLGLAFGSTQRGAIGADELAARAAEDLARAVSAASETLSPDERRALAACAEELRSEARRAALDQSAEAAERLAELRRELASRAAALDPTSPLARELERIDARLGAAERRADAPSRTDEAAPPIEVRQRPGVARAATDGAGTAASTGESSTTTEGAASQSPSPPAGVLAAPATGPPEAASVRAAWLEPAEAVLVEAWIEARRTSALVPRGE